MQNSFLFKNNKKIYFLYKYLDYKLNYVCVVILNVRLLNIILGTGKSVFIQEFIFLKINYIIKLNGMEALYLDRKDSACLEQQSQVQIVL